MRHIHSKTWLWTEAVTLFVALPILLYLILPLKLLLPTIWLAALCCHLGYRGLTGAQAWWVRAAGSWVNLRPILVRFVISALLLTVATAWLKPEMLFVFIRTNPAFWLLIMLAYPILSVVPQEIIFRSFFFTRYGTIFTKPAVMVVASGLAFGLAHILFHNWVAPVLCLVGGAMFASTYQKHRSLMLVALEHALYGDFIFTVGLGRYFYHGAVVVAH